MRVSLVIQQRFCTASFLIVFCKCFRGFWATLGGSIDFSVFFFDKFLLSSFAKGSHLSSWRTHPFWVKVLGCFKKSCCSEVQTICQKKKKKSKTCYELKGFSLFPAKELEVQEIKFRPNLVKLFRLKLTSISFRTKGQKK